MQTQKIICAGFGGQGVMSMGQLITYAGMLESKEVSWLPSYGPEMRGGTANCSVMVSETPIGSPVITNDATSAIIMNLPSLTKFEKDVAPGGSIFINRSLIEKKVERTDVDVYYIDANEIALELGNPRVANMVMLGALIEINKTVSIDSVLEAFKKVFGPSKEKFVPLNKEAIEKGMQAVRESVK